jgi:bacterioferritin-associated ferredoxin
MVICICANVGERELLETIAAGATTVKEVGRRCGAGAGCGACRPLIRECLKSCRAVAVETPRERDAGADLVPA